MVAGETPKSRRTAPKSSCPGFLPIETVTRLSSRVSNDSAYHAKRDPPKLEIIFHGIAVIGGTRGSTPFLGGYDSSSFVSQPLETWRAIKSPRLDAFQSVGYPRDVRLGSLSVLCTILFLDFNDDTNLEHRKWRTQFRDCRNSNNFRSPRVI